MPDWKTLNWSKIFLETQSKFANAISIIWEIDASPRDELEVPSSSSLEEAMTVMC